MKAAAPHLDRLEHGDVSGSAFWSNTVVTQLVAGKSLSSLLPAFGEGLAQNAQAAGYKVVRN